MSEFLSELQRYPIAQPLDDARVRGELPGFFQHFWDDVRRLSCISTDCTHTSPDTDRDRNQDTENPGVHCISYTADPDGPGFP